MSGSCGVKIGIKAYGKQSETAKLKKVRMEYILLNEHVENVSTASFQQLHE
jgi:hypothetical protein